MTFQPNFQNLLDVLAKRTPERPTLFEFYFSNADIASRLSGIPHSWDWEMLNSPEISIRACLAAGYDYITLHGSDFHFPMPAPAPGRSQNMNEHPVITDSESLARYPFVDPGKCDASRLELAEKLLPPGMKVVVMGPCGILENVTSLVGFDNMCFMLYDDRALLGRIFDEVGQRMLAYYERALAYDCVGAIISNDDWGHIGGTMLAPETLREFVFPWHKRIAEAAHRAGRPAILHSCGNLEDVYEDIIEDMKFDGKHSFEDKILPVEDAYDRYGDRIAILGGLDVDFVSRSDCETIRCRASAILERTNCKGYALGTGNSVADYISYDKFMALISAVRR